jgi:hypothetical protein
MKLKKQDLTTPIIPAIIRDTFLFNQICAQHEIIPVIISRTFLFNQICGKHE